MDIQRQQFAIRVSRLRQDGNDLGAVNHWLHHGGGISWEAFQAIDPMGDFAQVAERQEKARRRNQWGLATSKVRHEP
jgi:hypothetical protein